MTDETNEYSMGFIIAIIVFAIVAYFRGCRVKEQAAAWERKQAENKWLQAEGERRRKEYFGELWEKEREKNSAILREIHERDKRRFQIWEDERIRQKAREGEGWW